MTWQNFGICCCLWKFANCKSNICNLVIFHWVWNFWNFCSFLIDQLLQCSFWFAMTFEKNCLTHFELLKSNFSQNNFWKLLSSFVMKILSSAFWMSVANVHLFFNSWVQIDVAVKTHVLGNERAMHAGFPSGTMSHVSGHWSIQLATKCNSQCIHFSMTLFHALLMSWIAAAVAQPLRFVSHQTFMNSIFHFLFSVLLFGLSHFCLSLHALVSCTFWFFLQKSLTWASMFQIQLHFSFSIAFALFSAAISICTLPFSFPIPTKKYVCSDTSTCMLISNREVSKCAHWRVERSHVLDFCVAQMSCINGHWLVLQIIECNAQCTHVSMGLFHTSFNVGKFCGLFLPKMDHTSLKHSEHSLHDWFVFIVIDAELTANNSLKSVNLCHCCFGLLKFAQTIWSVHHQGSLAKWCRWCKIHFKRQAEIINCTSLPGPRPQSHLCTFGKTRMKPDWRPQRLISLQYEILVEKRTDTTPLPKPWCFSQHRYHLKEAIPVGSDILISENDANENDRQANTRLKVSMIPWKNKENNCGSKIWDIWLPMCVLMIWNALSDWKCQ